MNVASLQLSRELFQLSKERWLGPPSECLSSSCMHHAYYRDGRFICPKYDLGYLLDKLPKRTEDIRDTVMLGRATDNQGWSVVYRDIACIAETPEDAACELAIALFKQEVPGREIAA